MTIIHTHTHPFNGPFSQTTQVSRYQKGKKPIWILLKQVTVSGSGISWAICKSASRSRQITMPVPHHSSFFTGQMPFLPPNQQRQSTDGNYDYNIITISSISSQYHRYHKSIPQNACHIWIWHNVGHLTACTHYPFPQNTKSRNCVQQSTHTAVC